MKKVLLLSSVHPATDPRIRYKITPALASCFNVTLALPSATISKQDHFKSIKLPKFDRLWMRMFLSHPIILLRYLRLQPDIVHIFVPELLPLAFCFRVLGSTIVYEVQENFYKKFEIKRTNNHWVFRKLFKRFDQMARKHFHFIFTDESYRQEYQTLSKAAALIRNYAPLHFIDSQKSYFPVRNIMEFFYTGVISMERSFDTLVAALVSLVPKYPDIKIHLFGPVRFTWSEAEKLPEFCLVRKHLVFYGYTDFKEVIPFAGKCLAGLALLKPLADYEDSYTTKLFEYMALNLPVITSDFPLYQKVVQESKCGFCIDPYQADQLADKMEWLIKNPAEAAEMGKRGRDSAEILYNWKDEEQVLLSFYQNLNS